MTFFSRHAQAVRGFLAGFLLVLGALIISELWPSVRAVGAAVALILLAVFFAKKIARSLHHPHHGHIEDAAVHVVAPGALMLINLLHPAVDGFSVYETFVRGGVAIGIVAILGVVLHEIVRQWALVIALRKMEFRRAGIVVAIAVLGLLAGVVLGFLGSHFTYRHEIAIDLVTLSAYAFIIAEFWYADHDASIKVRSWMPAVLGVIAALVFSVVFGGH